MSKKNKKGKTRESNSQLLERAERELAKGNAKSALKDAKVAFRNDPAPQARKLLEAAYAGRIEQLHRQNLLGEAQAVLRDLLDFKPVSPEVCERLPMLQVLVGDKDADPSALFAQRPELLNELTDKAVLDWKAQAPDYADVPRQVTAVREALTAIEGGDDQRATDLLQDIPRTSPLGDWKLFVRGLSAFYQQDDDRTTANWQRLDPARPAHRIARTLQAAAGEISECDAVDVASGVKRLNIQLSNGQSFDQLASLLDSWRTGNWRTFFNDVRRFRQRYGKSDATALQQISELAWRRAVREGHRYCFDRVRSSLPAPELDPNWNRALALLSEQSHQGNANDVEDAWKAYAVDVRKLTCLSDHERSLAEGLVYLRLARKFIEFAEYNASQSMARWDDDEQEDELRQCAVGFLKQSLQACPVLMPAYRELALLHEAADELDKAAAVYKKLLKQFPDDFDAQIWLAKFYLEREEPDMAQAYTSAARRLKPRDPKCVALTWAQQLATVRYLVKSRRFNEARAELKKLHEIRPPEVDLFALDVIAVAIEFKAKEPDAANQLLADAVAKLKEPTAVWLQMSCAAARYNLPKEIKKQFDERFKEAIRNVPTSETAGLLARFFGSLKANQINYTGRATQEKLALDYFRRAAQIQWNEEDLCPVCELLAVLPRQNALFKTMTSSGVARFPQSPRMLFLAGSIEMQQGPFYCDLDSATHYFRTAIALSEQAALPLRPEQIAASREALSQLEDFAERARSFASRLGYDDEDDYEEDDDDEDDYEDEDDWEDSDDEDDYDLGSIDILPPDLDMNAVIASMPPSLLEQMQQTAATTGMSLSELISSTIAMGIAEELKTPSQPRRGGRGSRANQTAFGFANDE